jgi:hypothetical protein
LTEIHKQEEKAHANGRHRHKLVDNGEFPESLEVMQVNVD